MSALLSTLAKEQAQGLGTNMNAIKYLNQDFEELRNFYLSCGQLFTDPTFPAAQESLGFKYLGPEFAEAKEVKWKRPGELVSKPQFITKGATKSDLCQGSLGDCWLVAAMASITLNQDLLARVIYPEQNFTERYAGIFHFQLWQYGQWLDVVIDDLLPTRKGKLLFVHSTDNNEFWSALLEKAYAKLNGSYEALKGGTATEAFEDFTGGIAERCELNKAPSNLYNIMKKALTCGSLLGSVIKGPVLEELTKEQLVKTHAYSITGAEEVHVGGNVVQLLRLRNPWGFKEWNGAWSDNSKEWDIVLPEEKAKLNYSAEDGEFWMAYPDFMMRYTRVDICNLTPDASSSDKVGQWALQQFQGSWKIGSTAGGCSNNKDTFWKNPQYKITLLEEDDDPSNNEKTCSFLVALMQDRRGLRKQGQDMQAIGFSIYKVPEEFCGSQTVRLNKKLLCGKSGDDICLRETTARFCLPPGEYVIIPYTFYPGQQADFTLRVFTEKQSKTQSNS